MKIAFVIAALVVAAIFVSHTKIEFDPFNITCKYWYRGVGFVLFFLGLAMMEFGDYQIGRDEGFKDGVNEVMKLIGEKTKKNGDD